MKFRHTIYTIAATLGLFLTSCSDEINVDPASVDGEATALVTVRLIAAPSVTVTAVTSEDASGTLQSRTINIDDPDDPDDEDNYGLTTEICNVWCVQFKGTTDDAIITGAPTYVSGTDLKSFTTDKDGNPSYGVELNALMVVSAKDPNTSVPITNTIVFLVNTFDPDMVFDSSLTLGQMKAVANTVAGEDNLFAFDDSGQRHLLFNGLAESIIAADGTTAIGCTIRRNVARVDFTMCINKNSGLTVTGATVGAALDHSYLLTNYDELPANFPDVTNKEVGISGVSYAVSDDGTTIDTTSNDDYDIFTYRFYVPANQRGTVEKSYLAPYKNTYAPHLATYLRIDGTYVESGTNVKRPVNITVYLGENFTDNYDLKPNHRYNMTLTMDDLDDDAYDSRIENISIIDYSLANLERANCYMLQPSETADYARRYIIPVDRIDTFWGGTGYEDDPSMCIYNARPWVPLVIWADFDYEAAGVIITTTSGEKSKAGDPLGHGTSDKIQVDVPAGAEGNIVVGVRRIDDDGNYLNINTTINATGDNLSGFCWSWHLWITDYRPDDIDTYQVHPVNGQYVYKVTGGAVHRYSGDKDSKGENKSWNSVDGEYANAFVMDRNLGARSYLPPNKDTEIGGPGYLYYQFGRKDPFFIYDKYVVWVPLRGKANAKASDALPKATNSVFFYGEITYINNPAEQIPTPVRMAQAGGGLHTYWYNLNCHSIWSWCQYDIDNGKKSILDPSPLGWELPHSKECWHDFRHRWAVRPTVSAVATMNTNDSGGTNDVKRGFKDDSATPLWYEYWPYSTVVGENDIVPTDMADKIIFPCTGRYTIGTGNPASGGFTNGGNGTYALWFYDPPEDNSTVRIFSMGTGSGYSSTDNKYHCDRVVPIRCVRYMDYR